MPPPGLVASGGNILAFKPGEGIRVAFPVRSDQSNPIGTLQGGILGNIFDDAFGQAGLRVLAKTLCLHRRCRHLYSAGEAGEPVVIRAECP